MPHFVARQGANLAEFLGDDHVGREPFEQRGIEPVERFPRLERCGDDAVDLGAGQPGRHLGPGDARELRSGGRIIALVTHPDERVPRSERKHDLGRGRKQCADAHHVFPLRDSFVCRMGRAQAKARRPGGQEPACKSGGRAQRAAHPTNEGASMIRGGGRAAFCVLAHPPGETLRPRGRSRNASSTVPLRRVRIRSSTWPGDPRNRPASACCRPP